MQGDFDKMFGVLMDEEGGYVNDPKDPGGETKYGITWATLKDAIAKDLVPATATVKDLTTDQAKAIYKPDYWDAVHGDELPWPMCCFVFDAAVNQGTAPAIKMLQRALDLPQDGVLGPVTIGKLVQRTSAPSSNRFTCARFMAFRTMRYQSTRNFDVFGESWLIRCFELAMRIN